MSASENKRLIQEMYAALSRGDGATFLAALADDVEFNISGTTQFSGVMRGKKEVIERLLVPLGAALPGGITVTIDSILAEGDRVVAQGRGSATTKAGKPYNNRYCWVFRIEGGKVKEVSEYLDTELVTTTFGR